LDFIQCKHGGLLRLIKFVEFVSLTVFIKQHKHEKFTLGCAAGKVAKFTAQPHNKSHFAAGSKVA